MSYKIVVDSCCELPEELKQDGHYETVSLELEVDGCRIKDDSTFNQLDFLRRVKESPTGSSRVPCQPQVSMSFTGEIYGSIPHRCGSCVCSDTFLQAQWQL